MSTNYIPTEIEMSKVILQIQMAGPAFQRKNLFRLKHEIINNLDNFQMSEERKSYLLHQLSNVHDLTSAESLIKEMNLIQRTGNQS